MVKKRNNINLVAQQQQQNQEMCFDTVWCSFFEIYLEVTDVAVQNHANKGLIVPDETSSANYILSVIKVDPDDTLVNTH